MTNIRSVCVYCGSSAGNNGLYHEAGLAFGRALGAAGIRLVFGGGTRGIMGAVAAGCLEAGGKVSGIIPRFLINKEAGGILPEHFDELVITENMHQRKHAMFERSDAFVALPGGIGTLEEIVEIMTWAQLGRHHRPMAFANIAGFWNPMLALLSHMREEGFVRNEPPLIVADTVEEILPLLQAAAAGGAGSDGALKAAQL